MSWDPGSDFETVDGQLLPDMRLMVSTADKARAMLAAIARRLWMPRGGLWFDPDAGLSICEFVADTVDPRIAANQINAECLKDERCARASTDIAIAGDAWTIATTITAQDGKTYQLVFLATAQSATLLFSGPTP
jgi:hypothetical protein